MTKTRKLLLTSLVLFLAIGVLVTKYWSYVTNPWTRDGQVRAQVVQITPRVTGPIVQLPVQDNQFVRAGELLFEIDPRTFEAALEYARADLEQTRYEVSALEKQVKASKAEVELQVASVKQAFLNVQGVAAKLAYWKSQVARAKKLVPKGAMSQRMLESTQSNYDVEVANYAGSKAKLLQEKAAARQAEADLAKARANLGVPGELNARLRLAKASLREAELNLEFTQVRAPVDGFATNLNLRLGSQAVANQPALALVDVNSFWVHGFFRENYIEPIRRGDRAIITLMTYPDTPIEGRVESIGWGIAQQDGSVGEKLLPSISPTFEWIRLAQRVPVRVRIVNVPDEVKLRVGTTASVLVMTGTSGSDGESTEPAVAAPRTLQ